VIVAMMEWGNKHGGFIDGPPMLLRHRTCGEITHPKLTCDHCGDEVVAREVEPLPGPGAT
jgi:hypothetical protein